jgi:MoxR-like ATPase
MRAQKTYAHVFGAVVLCLSVRAGDSFCPTERSRHITCSKRNCPPAESRSICSLEARQSRYVSEEDLFEDDGYYGGKSYGSKNAVASKESRDPTSKRALASQEDEVDDDEAAAWAQYYDNDPSDDTKSFPERTDEATKSLRSAARAIMEEQKWSSKQLDAEHKEQAGNYQDQIKAAIEFVSRDLVEREEESRLVVLAMLAKEHLLLLGPPGTGKSMVARRLGDLVSDGGGFFQRLLTKFTTPEEIFGPLSLRALENDEYKRVTDGFLPSASVGFLDEIFKANSAILNTLLTILNERKFDNGGLRTDCPVRCVIGASNELPEDEELDALYDRFLLRKEVRAVSDAGLLQLLTVTPSTTSIDADKSRATPHSGVSSLDEASEVLSVAANGVTIPDHIATLIRNLRAFMNDELDVEVSDRRLVQSARLIRLSAATHGRKYVDPIDCLLLQDIVWQLPEERPIIRQWLWDNLTPGGEGSEAEILQYKFLLDGLKASIVESIRATGGDVMGKGGARKKDVAAVVALRDEVARLSGSIQALWDALARHSDLLDLSHVFLSSDESKAAKQLLLPKAQKSMETIEEVLVNARALELALSDDVDRIDDDVRLAAIEGLWEAGQNEINFSDAELDMSTREAKKSFDGTTFRAWRRAQKKMKKEGQ